MKPNVLLIVMDSVRARNVGLYGHEHRTTPFLEEFATGATVFRQARSPGTWSLPSHVSAFTGLHVEEHKIRRAKHKLRPGNTIFEELRDDHGYRTGVFSENTWITDMDVGLKDAFDDVEGARNLPYPDAIDPNNFVLSEGQGRYLEFLKRSVGSDRPLRSIANGVVTKLAWDYPAHLPDRFKATTPADVYTDLFLDWEAERDGPWAACVNFMDAHLPYQPDDGHDQWGGEKLRALQNEIKDQVWAFNGGHRPWWQRKALEGLYDGCIHQIDAEIRRIVETLEERGDREDTLIVVTSDHGEGFGEKSEVRPDSRIAAHGAGIHERLLHVPLVVEAPGQERSREVAQCASLTRFPAAVRAAIDGEPDPESAFVPEGRVLASSHGLEEPMEERARRFVDDLYRFNGDARAVYEDGDDEAVKYVTWRSEAATVRAPRPSATYRYSRDGADVVETAFDRLEPANVREDADRNLDAATEERLKDLGYV